MNTNSCFYIYVYPIISSIIAGLIFWFIFTVLPEQKRRKSILIGIYNDFYSLNNLLFQYFDIVLKSNKQSPSFYQDKIKGCTLTEEEINICLQNKVANESYLFDKNISDRLMVIGNELEKITNRIDNIVENLFAFNFFLSPDQLYLFRNIKEKVHRYSFDSKACSEINGQIFYPLNPSLSHMTKVLLELQIDFLKLRKYLFYTSRFDRDFVISKMQMLYFSGDIKECRKLCQKWLNKYPYDSELQMWYLIKIFHESNDNKIKNKSYQLMESLLTKNNDIMSKRHLFYNLLSDSVACSIIFKKATKENVDAMKKTVEQEMLIQQVFITSNTELKKYYTEKK